MNSYNLEFNIKQEPWSRPVNLNKSQYLKKDTMVNSLQADFKDKIKFEFIAEAYRTNKYDGFPRSENIGLAMDIKSKDSCILITVVKNIADALNRQAYYDDVKVISLLSTIEIGNANKVKVGILVDDKIRPYDTIDSAFSKSFINFEVEARPIDKVLSVPKNPDEPMAINPINIAHQTLIEREIKTQYNGVAIIDDVKVSIDIDTLSVESDIDNIALNYLLALEGTVIKDIRQVKCLYLNINRSKADKASMKIEVL